MKINITGDYVNLLDRLKQIDNTYYITEEDSLRVLEECGISNSKEVLEQLKRAGKGGEFETKKIKITKLK